VGDGAKRQAAQNVKRTLFNVKRIIGRQFSECGEDVKRMPFSVQEGPGGKPVVAVEVAGKRRTFAPEQISAMVRPPSGPTQPAHVGSSLSPRLSGSEWPSRAPRLSSSEWPS
jgi:L1 cell adhesion molecule like protein